MKPHTRISRPNMLAVRISDQERTELQRRIPGTLTMEVRYEIVHERQFDEQMARIMGSMERGDAFMRPIEWDLARGAERGYPIAENAWRLEKRDGGAEALRIDYVRDEATRRIHLLSITR